MLPISRRLQQHAWLVAAVVFVLSLLVIESLIRRQALQQAQQQRTSAQHWAREQARVIESRVQRLLSSTYMLAALVRKDDGQVTDFDRIAKDLWPSFPGLQAMALAPNGVIRYIWPLENNRAALNADLFSNPDQARGAALARDTGTLTIDGPLPLLQGGWGMVGRLPIWLEARGKTQRFWGLASVSIRFPDALVATGLPALTEMGYGYRLWRERENGTRDLIAESSPGESLADPVEERLHVPNGDWVLTLAPRDGWQAGHQQVLHIAAFVVALLLAYVAKLILDLRRQKGRLEDTVLSRTQEVVANEAQLRATLDAIPDLLFELDIDGRIFVVHTSDKGMLLAPPEQLVGRQIDDFFRRKSAPVRVKPCTRRCKTKAGSMGNAIRSTCHKANVGLNTRSHSRTRSLAHCRGSLCCRVTSPTTSNPNRVCCWHPSFSRAAVKASSSPTPSSASSRSTGPSRKSRVTAPRKSLA